MLTKSEDDSLGSLLLWRCNFLLTVLAAMGVVLVSGDIKSLLSNLPANRKILRSALRNIHQTAGEDFLQFRQAGFLILARRA